MKKNFILKIFVCLFMMSLLIPTVDTYALGWPVTDVEADETEPVEEEEVVITTDEALSATGGSTLEDDAIFTKDQTDLVGRLTANSNSETLDKIDYIHSQYADVVPTVTTDQMVEWILKKGNELISILQVIAQPFAIIIFIVSCAVCLIGSLAKGNMMGKGLIGMVASAVLYAACLYAPIIVNSISNFMSS